MIRFANLSEISNREYPGTKAYLLRIFSRASGATKEAAASKIAEQKLAGQAQEARLRSHVHGPSPLQPSPTVMVNGKPVARKGEIQDDVHDHGLWERTQQESPNVLVQGKEAFRKDHLEAQKCEDPKSRK